MSDLITYNTPMGERTTSLLKFENFLKEAQSFGNGVLEDLSTCLHYSIHCTCIDFG